MKKLAVFIIFLLNITILYACFWDYDTIEMERQQFPGIIELISGKFLRHSTEFHQWRIKDREEKLKKYPDSLSLYDDLAVSYSKIGNDRKAIEIILQKEKIRPGLYKTYANLGTFYLHNNQYKKGIEFIDKAIAVNPEAHFGREIYQKYLAEYVLSKMQNGETYFPLNQSFPKYADYHMHTDIRDGFYYFLFKKYSEKQEKIGQNKIRKLPDEELEKAISGVTGMMKFGNYNSPILLEALGDLLMNTGWGESARQLAARAYLKASYKVEDSTAKEIYYKRISFALFHQFTKKNGTTVTFSDLEKLLNEEIEEGEDYFQQIKNDEIDWIKNGKNPEVEFSRKYYKNPQLSERIQLSKGKLSDAEKKYLKDTTIGILTPPEEIPVPKKEPVDSITKEIFLDEVDPIEATDETLKPQKNNRTKNYLYISLFIIGSIVVGCGLWLFIRK